MLEHQKLVLQNVAFSKTLFTKELAKSIAWLSEQELEKLHEWLFQNFPDHQEIIREMFQVQPAD